VIQAASGLVAARATIGAMKAGSASPIRVGEPPVAFERPIPTAQPGLLGSDASLITEWRNRYPVAFLTEFWAETQRTEEWLRDVVGPDQTRLLFMLEDASGRPFGHLGLAHIDLENHRAELDSVVRGEPIGKGVMGDCVATLARWASVELGTTSLYLRVRSDNDAVGFYEHIGFRRTRRVPLRPEADGDEVRWVEDPDAAGVIDVIYMDYEQPEAEGERADRSQSVP
jgi:RimJ/RimL family protein N-acetyltransferase